MTLILDGYWEGTYWADRYFPTTYWPGFPTVEEETVSRDMPLFIPNQAQREDEEITVILA